MNGEVEMKPVLCLQCPNCKEYVFHLPVEIRGDCSIRLPATLKKHYTRECECYVPDEISDEEDEEDE